MKSFNIFKLSAFAFLCFTIVSCSQQDSGKQSENNNVQESEVASQLFSGLKSKLNSDDKNQISTLTGLTYDAASKTFMTEGEGVEVQVVPVDINNDKTEDIFVITYSSFLYGNTGQGFSLFMKDESGKFKNTLSLPGIPELLYESSESMPSIRVGGPGFDFPIYKWKSHSYKLVKNSGKVSKALSLEEAGQQYTNSIK